MNSVIVLAVLLYLIAGIGFAKMWSSAYVDNDGIDKFFGCLFWPLGLVISAFWSW